MFDQLHLVVRISWSLSQSEKLRVRVISILSKFILYTRFNKNALRLQVII